MRTGCNLATRVFCASIVVGFLTAKAAVAQTPIPTLPPLPKMDASEAPTPVPTPVLTPVPTPVPAAAASLAPAAAPPSAEPPSAAPARSAAERPAAPEAGGLPSSVILLLGIGVLVLVATLVVVLTVLLKKPVVINVPSRSASPPPGPEGPGREAPGAATSLGVLPGRFLVDEGDRETELRIHRTAPGERVETTIGRDPGPAYRHIQLLPPSVAGKHAKLVFDKRSHSIINYARANPTRVNGEELGENESRRLVDNDRIEIGDVVMTFRED